MTETILLMLIPVAIAIVAVITMFIVYKVIQLDSEGIKGATCTSCRYGKEPAYHYKCSECINTTEMPNWRSK